MQPIYVIIVIIKPNKIIEIPQPKKNPGSNVPQSETRTNIAKTIAVIAIAEYKKLTLATIHFIRLFILPIVRTVEGKLRKGTNSFEPKFCSYTRYNGVWNTSLLWCGS
jgi:hypothetical protein